MADIQSSFRKFHDAIALKRDAEKAILADKRQKVLDRVNEGLAKQRAAGTMIPSYTPLNQGSYRMGTGIKPVDGDYDLDVAILFELDKGDEADPVTVKKWILDAVDGHTKNVEMKGPCVTVQYVSGGEPAYHVDLAIYAAKNADGKTYLARGKLNSAAESRIWEESDPRALISHIENKYSDAEDAKQFRRTIRYLKRWRDENFTKDGNAAPLGIALTAAAIKWFRVEKATNAFRNTTTYDDLAALIGLVKQMLNGFSKVYDAETKQYVDRLSVTLPVPPGNDLFGRMSHGQIATFKERLEKLKKALEEAERDPDPHTASLTLRDVFGKDFPETEKSSTAMPRGPAIVSSGNSG